MCVFLIAEQQDHQCLLLIVSRPATGIRTQVTDSFNLGDDSRLRKPSIFADACLLLVQDNVTGQTLIDEVTLLLICFCVTLFQGLHEEQRNHRFYKISLQTGRRTSANDANTVSLSESSRRRPTSCFFQVVIVILGI